MAHILVIDDEQNLREVLQKILTAEGHTVNTAENGKIGLELFKQDVYDLIITDIIMPEQDGYEVISAIRKKSPDPKIIAVTGGSRRMDVNDLMPTARCLGAEKVIAKPINYEALKLVVKELLESPEA